jgi:hypothetical protein
MVGSLYAKEMSVRQQDAAIPDAEDLFIRAGDHQVAVARDRLDIHPQSLTEFQAIRVMVARMEQEVNRIAARQRLLDGVYLAVRV